MLELPTPWALNWMWGLPLVVGTVLIHVSGLLLVRRLIHRGAQHPVRHRYQTSFYLATATFATLWAIVLHALEAIVWARAYLQLNALPDLRSAMLYSLNAITSYGHTSLTLQPQWLLMGAIESLNGWLLLGLSTAFLVDILQRLRG